uniref:Uncharacterized protein n=1 Tax=Avena sativa TaxID=4498 RepID=A0ACD5W574_AVESA
MSAKTLAQLAKKWQMVVAIRRKRLTWLSSTSVEETEGSRSSVAGKGYCVVYTADGTWFEVPLAFLSTTVLSELLRMSQEEFGFTGADMRMSQEEFSFTGADSGRIMLPCDASLMEYAMYMLRRSASADMEAVFLSSMGMPCHYHVEPDLGVSQHFCVCCS